MKDPHAPRVSIEVTQEIIDKACVKNTSHCMIAEAIAAQIPEARNITVDLAGIRWSNPKKGLRYVYIMPPLASANLIQFDKGKKVQPFRLSLRKAHVSSMERRPKNGPRKAVHNLGKPRLVPTKQDIAEGTMPDVVGGTKRMRLAALAKGREYGSRQYTGIFDAEAVISDAEFAQRTKGYLPGARGRKSKH